MMNKPGNSLSSLVRGAHLIAPNGLLAIVVGFAISIELILVAFSPESIYSSMRTTMVGITFIAWFWVTLGWALYFLGCGCRAATKRMSKFASFAVWSVVTLLLVIAVLLYGISWFLFLHSGRFANFETWRFITFNFDHLWTYVVEAEPIHLVTAAVLFMIALTTVPLALFWSSGMRWSDHKNVAGKQFAVWLVLWIALYGNWCNLSREQSVHLRVNHSQALMHRLHPTMTMYASHLQSRNRQPIEDCLDATTLTPLPPHDAVVPASAVDNSAPSVIFVAVESLRQDTIYKTHQGKAILPNINQLARNGIQLTRAYAQSTHSDYADVCLVSSLYPLRTRNHFYYGPRDPYPRTLIYDILEPAGYATAIISSQNEAWGGMVHFLRRPSLQHFYHPETSKERTIFSELDTGFAHEVRKGGLVAGKLTDAHTTDMAIEWIEQQVRAERPFFVSMNFQSSHFPYLIPDDCPRPFQPATLDPSISFVDYPEDQTEFVMNAYYNSIHECDRQVGRLVEALRRLRTLDNTILVVTGENGESFHECDSVTHAREPVQPAIHVACVIHAPDYLEAGVEDYPFEHVDLVPTVLGLMGRPSHPNFQGIDIFSPDRPPADQRLTFCHVNSCFAQGDTVMLGGRWKLTQDHRKRELMLHDVVNDPMQTTNLLNDFPDLAKTLGEVLSKWRREQLAYYHFPAYYTSYYPPQPPRWPAAATGEQTDLQTHVTSGVTGSPNDEPTTSRPQ